MRKLTLIFLLFPILVWADDYYSWIDQNGVLRNSFIERNRVTLAEIERYKSLSLSDYVAEDNRIASVAYQIDPLSEKEKKRKYYTWVEADGRTHNTEYATAPQSIEKKTLVLQGGELASDYIDGDQLARQGFLREEESLHYSWVDPTGRLVSSEYTPGSNVSIQSRTIINYTDANQYLFEPDQGDRPVQALGDLVPSLSSEPKSVISLDKKLVARIKDTCCAQIPEESFYSLTPEDSVYEKLGELSPSYEFPTGQSYYLPIRLPVSQQTYGIKVKSFAQKGVFYPVLLFLDENRQPTRYVTDSVVEYHEETWDRYAHLEGRIMIKPSYGERFVLIFTTQEDLKRITQRKQNLAVLAEHEHSRTGSLEVKVIY
ncbi:MalM family protein [Litoribrevibacter albus]|uniref:DUF4124 domain-containing protein n=1 Tax=Litoribrevibacter albus TaxID=1473156 RepID=A0AA37SDJ4_9GAMM|nr:MalM family protein [Litoribrevibacter albus]GLQ33218.1 hypothetical protein GCM10007876_36980 [Litoribrevibacter albus]